MKTEKKILTMAKEHSPHLIVFSPDEDPHFVNMKLISKATGETTANHYILKSDVSQLVSQYEGDGFSITN